MLESERRNSRYRARLNAKWDHTSFHVSESKFSDGIVRSMDLYHHRRLDGDSYMYPFNVDVLRMLTDNELHAVHATVRVPHVPGRFVISYINRSQIYLPDNPQFRVQRGFDEEYRHTLPIQIETAFLGNLRNVPDFIIGFNGTSEELRARFMYAQSRTGETVGGSMGIFEGMQPTVLRLPAMPELLQHLYIRPITGK